MDNIEQMLKTSLNQEIDIPKSVLEKAEGAFAEIRNSKVELSKQSFWLGKKQLVASAIALICLGVAFNQPAIAEIKYILWANHAGLEKAINSGYDQKVQTGYVQANGIGTKITNVTVDKSRLALSIAVKLTDINAVKKTSKMHLDLVITDGNGNVIFGEGYPNQPIGGYEESTNFSNIENGELVYNVLLDSPTASIPQTNKLNVKVKSISLFAQTNWPEPPFKTYEGPWINTITLEGQFAKANGIAYIAKNNSKDLTITSAEMLPTGLAIKFVVNPVDAYNIELVDSNGKTYQNSGISSSDRTSDNKDLVSTVFEVSQFDKIDSFELHVKCKNGKESTVTLVRDAK